MKRYTKEEKSAEWRTVQTSNKFLHPVSTTGNIQQLRQFYCPGGGGVPGGG
jgi:hypothetical protein